MNINELQKLERKAEEGDSEAKKELDKLADKSNYEGFSGFDGADRDYASSTFSGRGSGSFSRYMYGD